MKLFFDMRLPNGDRLRILRRDIIDAALGRRRDDYRPLYKSESNAHHEAVRRKLDRVNSNLAWLRLLVVALILVEIAR